MVRLVEAPLEVFIGVLLMMSWCNVSSAFAPSGNSGWVKAHATFYGGSDASGTMGIESLFLSFVCFLFHTMFFFYSIFVIRVLGKRNTVDLKNNEGHRADSERIHFHKLCH